jgi:hypothetical protein
VGNPNTDDYLGLRRKLDGSDPLMRGVSTFGASRGKHADRVANIGNGKDAWTFSDLGVRQVLARAFPNMETNRLTDTQRKRMLRWLAVIYRFFRRGQTAGRVAMVLHITPKQIEDTARRMRRVAIGFRTTGVVRSGKMGRKGANKVERRTQHLLGTVKSLHSTNSATIETSIEKG